MEDVEKVRLENKFLDELLNIAEIQNVYNRTKQLELFDFMDR